MLQQGTLFDNRYKLTRFIGRGGFAEVWLVNDTLTGLEEALKIYAPGSGMDEDGLKLFIKELSVVHDLRHTNLLTPKTLGQYNHQPYLVLPFCPNGSLNKSVGQCTENEAWNILKQVASGLAYLHQRKIVHQDIKPDNILVDANMDYVITDFGISLKAQSTLRKSMREQANSGTMAYMAPERFSKEPHPIPANDIWSLGAMMFELVEGDVPFMAQIGGLAQMNGAQIPTMHSSVGNNLKQVILSMLAVNPNDRPTAVELADPVKRQKDSSQSITKESVTPSHDSDAKSTRRLDKEKLFQVSDEVWVADDNEIVVPPKKEPAASSDDKKTKRISASQASSTERQGTSDSLPHFCRKCGNPLKPGASFCSKCGTDVKKKKNYEVAYVDIGLPSGTLWENQTEENFYTYDEAIKRFGKNLPTKEQWEELMDTCKWTWNGCGYIITGPNGYAIELPAKGYFSRTGSVWNENSGGYYWSYTPTEAEKAWELELSSKRVYLNSTFQTFMFSVRLVK